MSSDMDTLQFNEALRNVLRTIKIVRAEHQRILDSNEYLQSYLMNIGRLVNKLNDLELDIRETLDK